MTTASRARTGDRGPPAGSPEIYTVHQIGPKRAFTPNGNLICYDVPIARTGTLLYRAGEIPLKPGPDGVIRVERTAEALFRPETIGSFMGVAVTDDHPPELEVTPKTWKRLAYGFSTTNVRRGENEDSDVLFADLIITDKTLIEQILSGKVEVSAGYDAEYEQTSDGEGLQTDIIGNHIALVSRGRCGPRCSIGDHDPFSKGKKMTIRKRLTQAETVQRIRALVGDVETLLEDTQDPPGAGGADISDGPGGTHIHIHTGSGGSPGGDPNAGNMPNTLDNGADPNATDPNAQGGDVNARVAALETGMKQLAGSVAEILNHIKGASAPGGGADSQPGPGEGGDDDDPEFPKTGDNGMPSGADIPADDKKTGDNGLPEKDTTTAHKTGDSAALARGFQELLSDAEVLVPGTRVPTFDAKANRATTVDRMCSIRRRTMDSFYATPVGKQVVDTITGKSDFDVDGMDCKALAGVFKSSAAAQRVVNNRAATGDASHLGTKNEPVVNAPTTAADINRINAEFYSKKAHA